MFEIISEAALKIHSRFQFHMSVEPNLIPGKSFAEQTRTVSQSGSRGDAGEGNGQIYTTHDLFYWSSQIAYEDVGDFPNYVYLVFVREGGHGTIHAAHQDMSPPQDVIVLVKIGDSDPNSDDVPDYGRMMAIGERWVKQHGQAVVQAYARITNQNYNLS